MLMDEVIYILEVIKMTQISIQVDANNTSVSKWIEDRVHRELKQEWPENYFSLFGILDEGDLVEPSEIPFIHEGKRESL